MPAATLRVSGGSTNGNLATSPSPRAVIWRITEARLVRRISGSVNSGRAAKSSSAYSRMQMPAATRPHPDYMPKVGSLGLDMMYRTSTVQVNMDYASEADMVKKLRVSLALQPVATAIFANSPFTDGKPNGYLSMRSNIWLDTDKDRTGMIAFAFEDGFGSCKGVHRFPE